MNYEQKNRLIALCDSMKSYGYADGVEELKSIFPELRESEDERMMKAILATIRQGLDTEIVLSNYGLTYDDVEAWLEKQKALSELGKYIAAERTKPGFMFAGNDSVSWEELPLDVRKHDYPYYFIGDLDCYPFDVGKQKEQKRDLELTQHWYMDGYIDGKSNREPRWNLKAGKEGPMYEKNEKYGQPLEQKEQKPAEWSKIDRLTLDSIVSIVEDWENEQSEEEKEYYGATQKSDWLKALPERFNLQPKQELSEEDEENFKWFDKFFRAESVIAGGRDIPQDKYLWFKSLRPQNRTKSVVKRIYKAKPLKNVPPIESIMK